MKEHFCFVKELEEQLTEQHSRNTLKSVSKLMLCCPVALRALMAAVLWESNTLSIKHTCLFQRLQSTNTNTFLLKALTLKCLLWSKITPSCVTGSHLTVLKFLLYSIEYISRSNLPIPFCTLHSLEILYKHLPSAIQYFGTVDLNHLLLLNFAF